MLSLRTAFNQNQVTSVRGLRSALGPERSSVSELLRINLIHQHYVGVGGHTGPLGLPTSPVEFTGAVGTRQYRGGEITILGEGVQALAHHEASIRFLGFRCVEESSHDQSTAQDEPYFIITVDTGNGAPIVKKFGEFDGIITGTEMGFGELLLDKAAPNPMSIRVAAFENDRGDPDATARKIQDEVVKLSQQAASLASAASAADGPGVGVAAGAGTIGGIAGGPIGALLAVGAVELLGLGDDFVGQAVDVLFVNQNDVGTPAVKEDRFQNNEFNRKIVIDGGAEGKYELFFDVRVKKVLPPEPV